MSTVWPPEPGLIDADATASERAVIYSLVCPGRESAPATGWNIPSWAPLITFRKFTVAADPPIPSRTAPIPPRKLTVEWLASAPDRIVIRPAPGAVAPQSNARSAIAHP